MRQIKNRLQRTEPREFTLRKFLAFSIFCTLFSVLSALWVIPLLAADTPPAAAPGGFGVSLGPSQIRLQGVPGETQESSVRIWNQSQNTMRFIVEIADLGNEVAKDGALNRVFVTPGSFAHSCAGWIQLSQSDVEVPAGQHLDIKFLMAVPTDAVGGHAAVIFFRGMPAAQNGDERDPSKPTTSVQIQPRIGVLVFHEAKGTVQRTGKLSDFVVQPPVDGEPLSMTYLFENTGNVDILLEGSFYVLGANNALAAKGRINTLRTFPEDRGSSGTEWEGALDSGEYHLVASFELGPDGQEVIVREADFEVPEEV